MTKVQRMRWWDLPVVDSLERECFPHDAWTVEQFWSELAQPTRCYYVAVQNESIVGYAGAFVLAPDSDIQTLAVDPRHRGQGIADALVSELLACAIQTGATAMILEVRADNRAAIEVYQRHGFAPISKRSRYYPDGADALIMQRRPLESA